MCMIPSSMKLTRNVSFARYDNLKQALSDLEGKDIVASIDKAKHYVHNLVITAKRDVWMRVCLDPNPLNKALKGALYIIQILCRRYTYWSYPTGLTIYD